MAFKPGESGNPGGRPKAVEGVKELARLHTENAIAALVRVIEDKKANPSARVSAAVAILDRGWGKPVQAIAGANGEDPIELVHRVERVIVRPSGSDS